MTEQAIAQGGQAELDTFESPIQLSPEQVNEAISKGEEKPEVKEKVSEDSQVNMLSEEEAKDEKKDEPESFEKEEEAKSVEVKKDVPAEAEKVAPEKSIRLKDGEEAVDIRPEATIKVKVKGKSEFVAIKDLMENYSGKKAWDGEFQKIAEEKKTFQQTQEKHNAEIKEISHHFSTIAGILDAKDKNPLEALQYLVDMSGRNVYDFNKKMHSYMQGEVQKLAEMSEVEQELYWKEQELSWIRGTQKAKDEQMSKRQAHEAAVKKADSLRAKHGITIDKYSEVHDKLMDLAMKGKIALKPEQITMELVVEQAAYEPIIEKANKLCEPYGEELGDDDLGALINQVAVEMFHSPKLKEDDALIIAAKKLGFDVQTEEMSVKELEKKLPPPPPKKAVTKNSSDKPESFEDFE